MNVQRTISSILGRFISRERFAEFQIFFSVLLAGCTFVIDRFAMINGLAPITYNAWKYIISSLFLHASKYFSSSPKKTPTTGISSSLSSSHPIKLLSSNFVEEETESEFAEGFSTIDSIPIEDEKLTNIRAIYFWGIICGLGDSGASIFQQIGLVTVSADKTSFIIGMYVVLVPIVTWAVPGFGEGGQASVWSWLSVLLSMAGLYLLSGCAEEQVCVGGALGQGEFFVFVSMLFWVVAIIAGDMAAKRVDVLAMTSVAFLTCAVVTLTLAVVFEPASWSFPLSSVRRNSAVIVASALLEAVGFTVGTMGQEYTPPTRAALLFSLSSVVCAVAGYVCLDEQLTGLEGLGCLLMTAAAALPNICEGADKDKDGGGDGDGDGELGSGPLRSMQIGTRRAESPKSRLLGYDFGSFSDMNSGSNSHSAGSLGSTISIWILGIKKLFVPQQPFYTSPIT